MVFVVDVGNWFVHKRHLQMQADAGALAGGGSSRSRARRRDRPRDAVEAGDPSTAPATRSTPDGPGSNVHVLINSASYWNEGGTDYSDGGAPCATKFVDVKITEADLPGTSPVRRRAGDQRARPRRDPGCPAMGGALPVAVPDVDRRSASVLRRRGNRHRARVDPAHEDGLLDERDDDLGQRGGADSVPINSSRIGVRVALGGGVDDDLWRLSRRVLRPREPERVVYVRGWSTAGRQQPKPPIARDVPLYSGSCPDPYFNVAASCSIGVSARRLRWRAASALLVARIGNGGDP